MDLEFLKTYEKLNSLNEDNSYTRRGDVGIIVENNILLDVGMDVADLIIPNGVIKIEDQCLSKHTALKSVYLPDSLQYIGDYAFYNCTGLTSIVIPKSVISIGYAVFYYCGNLTSITFTGTEAQWNAISKGNYWNLCTNTRTVQCIDGRKLI